MKILVTGCAGFIGFHTALSLLNNHKCKVFGIDNLNKTYDYNLKMNRLKILKGDSNFKFNKIDIVNYKKLKEYFQNYKFDYVIHLAAKAGVRDSIINPRDYLDSNINGFFNVLEMSRIGKIKHFIYASTSSVYGNSKKFPSSEEDVTDFPVSFYGASKKANEVLAYSYSSIYKLPTTGLRFFTVYGPYGRPDMAPYKFTELISNKKTIELFNKGNHVRDFTYIDDVVTSILKLLKKVPNRSTPYVIYNVGSQDPKTLKSLISNIEKQLGLKSTKKLLPFQKGDVFKTFSNNSKLSKAIRFKPKITLKEGVKRLVNWYKNY